MIQSSEEAVLDAARQGDSSGIGDLLEAYRKRLARMVAMRMDPRLQGRVDASDVLQEAFVEVSERLPRYLDGGGEGMPFFLWVRFITGQKLLQLHRRHLGAEARAVDREVALGPRLGPNASSIAVAGAWLATSGTPSQAVSAEEERERLRAALEDMNTTDREVLVLRHFEQLSNAEVAALLELTPRAASARYVRALTRLQGAVE